MCVHLVSICARGRMHHVGTAALGCPPREARPGVISPQIQDYRNASATFPLAINSASRAKSLYMTRSFSIVGHTDRIAA